MERESRRVSSGTGRSPRHQSRRNARIDIAGDRLPRAGEHNGLFYAMGFSGHGGQMSVHMGQQMAAVMAGDAAANPLRNLAWPAIFGHFGPPWFMPFVGAYYRYKDRIS